MILENIEWVVERSRHVRLDDGQSREVCAGLDPSALRLPDWRVPVIPSWRDERLVDFILLFNSINFCYWAEAGAAKWAVTFRGEAVDGAYGMMAALTRALEDEGCPLLEGETLAGMGPEAFRHILRGNVPIPLEAERLAIWHDAGAHLDRAFGGRWHEVVRRARGSAVRLVELLVAEFPSFDDAAEFEGRRVTFYKRAQLAAGMIYQAFGGEGWGAFGDIDELTVYADYKLPQVLRRLGILVYDEALAGQVDSLTPIPAGSRAEVEIRAATVCAGQRMVEALQGRSPGLTAAHLDFWLWEAGHQKPAEGRPYHRTRTTAY